MGGHQADVAEQGARRASWDDRRGGHVAKKLGDGLMALFGYPVAQENDAERAARAALSTQRKTGRMPLQASRRSTRGLASRPAQ
jgi:class 3 adenylate cyclase